MKHIYKGYEIAARMRPDGVGDVRVYYPSEVIPLYRTTSLDLAMRWIDAYRDGVNWAMQDARS